MDVSQQLNASLSDRYRIERELGAGGMATVYLAEDIKHRRKVALKVLRPELGAVLGTERFLTEINVSANLQHPHLLPLFDSGEANGLLFYVMPYISGESLRDRLNRERQLPVDEAIRIAAAVAGALDYAHRHGVVHRDLKPENILMNEGEPLVTDFGIALAISNAGGARVTQTGLSLGTPQYMSPEQATGDRVIDARSDIYSLAAVLYEMLTGEPPHMGTTVQAIIARVITDRPQRPQSTRETVPDHVDATIMRALSKLPADRFATAGEFAEALRNPGLFVTQHGVTGISRVALSTPVNQWRTRAKHLLNWSPLVIGLALLGSGIMYPRRSSQSSQLLSRFQVSSDSVDVLTEAPAIAISPDGEQIAFYGQRGGVSGIFLRRLDELDAKLVRGTESGFAPAFSPDGNWLVFNLSGGLRKVPITGGASAVIADVTGTGAHWGTGNQLVFGAPIISRVFASGGAPVLVAQPDSVRGHVRYAHAHVLPDGKEALITLWKKGQLEGTGELGVIDLATGNVRELGMPGVSPRYVSTGHIVFGRGNGIVFAAPFSLRRREVTGSPVPVLDDVSTRAFGSMDFAVSANGTLVYISGGGQAGRVLRVSRSGREVPLIPELDSYRTPRVSPDGRRLALSKQRDIWMYDIGARTLSRLTSSDGRSYDPEWTRDGQRIAYTNYSSGRARIDWQPWDRSGTPETLIQHDVPVWEISFGPTGKHIAIREDRPGGLRDILIAPAVSPTSLQPLLVTPSDERMPQIHTNGEVLAYVSNETGRTEVYVRSLPGPGGRVLVSTGGGLEPVWSRDGRELFYRTITHVMSATIAREPELSIIRRDTLFEDRYIRDPNHVQYDVFPGSNDFVFVERPPRGARLIVVLNWAADLQRRIREQQPRS